jgi:hypothetical protein
MAIREICAAVVFSAVLAGCSSMPGVRRAMTRPYRPTNVYLRQAALPFEFRRVAVMPVFQGSVGAAPVAGTEWFQALLLAELGKRNLFDLTPISPEDLRALIGTRTLNSADELPSDFFKRMRDLTGCDLVLFSTLTTYQAYPPLRTGIKARLVDCKDHYTWWAVDEVFDAGVESVAVAAEDFATSDLNQPNPLLGTASILRSPRRFSEYAAHAVAGTLPTR